jgi:hypothetical protein
VLRRAQARCGGPPSACVRPEARIAADSGAARRARARPILTQIKARAASAATLGAMGLRNKRRELHGLVGGIGVVAGLAGYVGGFYPPATATVAMFGIWIIGATLVNVFTD